MSFYSFSLNYTGGHQSGGGTRVWCCWSTSDVVAQSTATIIQSEESKNLQQALQNGGHWGLCLLSSSSFPLGKSQHLTSVLLGTWSYRANYTQLQHASRQHAQGEREGMQRRGPGKNRCPWCHLGTHRVTTQYRVQELLPPSDNSHQYKQTEVGNKKISEGTWYR